MEQLTEFAAQWWWAGLIPAALFFVWRMWHRWYYKDRVESQCVIIGGLTIGTIMLISYIISIIAGLFSIIGFFSRLGK